MAGVQIGPTSIRVTWTPPDPLGGVTGYRIHYTTGGGSSGSQTVSGGNTNSYTLTGFTNGEIYSLTIISTVSVGLPSTNQEVVTVGLGKSLYNTHVRFFTNVFNLFNTAPFLAPVIDTSPRTTTTSITVTGRVPSGSVVTGFIVSWQRNTSVGCPITDQGSTRVSGGFTSFTITGLEEDSRYTVSVRPFNEVGRGPRSNTVTAMTQEAGECSSSTFSNSSISSTSFSPLSTSYFSYYESYRVSYCESLVGGSRLQAS